MMAAQLQDPTVYPYLTPREKQVLQLVANGLSTDVIAKTLGIAFKTVACHRSRLLAKLDAPNAVIMVRKAIRLGLIDL